MGDNGKPAHGGNRERAGMDKTTGRASDPTMNIITISSVLSKGRSNALTGREIGRVLGLKDGRDVSSRVELERRRGVPICATCDSNRPGYFLPETPGELAEYNRSLQRRIKNISATADAMQRALDEWTGQTRVEGFDE